MEHETISLRDYSTTSLFYNDKFYTGSKDVRMGSTWVTNATLNVQNMTDEQFARALKERPWRNAVAADTAAPPEPNSDPVVTTSSTAAPPPPAPHKATKPALAMTDEEYTIARRNRAWRNS
jgi:hypothetical protein